MSEVVKRWISSEYRAGLVEHHEGYYCDLVPVFMITDKLVPYTIDLNYVHETQQDAIDHAIYMLTKQNERMVDCILSNEEKMRSLKKQGEYTERKGVDTVKDFFKRYISK